MFPGDPSFESFRRCCGLKVRAPIASISGSRPLRCGARGFWRRVLVYVMLVSLCLVRLSASASLLTEYTVKAAFLFNFGKFVEWPPEKFKGTNSPLVIGVMGKDPFGKSLEQVTQNKAIKNRPLVLQHLNANEDATACHVLFIGRSEIERIPAILAPLKGTAVLTVGETERFLEQGGMIEFSLESDTVKFAVNLDVAERSGLKLSSGMLKAAKTVKTATTK